MLDALIGITVFSSVFVGRPLAQAFGREVYPFPEEVRDSTTYARTFRTITLVWGTYFLLRSGVRLAALLTLSVDGYLLVDALSGAPFCVTLLAWSVVYTARMFRRSDEWGGEIVAAEARAVETASGLSP